MVTKYFFNFFESGGILVSMTNILFLCVGNSARSQIAEGLAIEMFDPHSFDIQSAGSHPAGYVHENAIATMSNIGIDISQAKSKSIEELEDSFLENINYVITLCSEEICPTLPSKAIKLHWPNPDPADVNLNHAQSKVAFTECRKSIYTLVKKLFTELHC